MQWTGASSSTVLAARRSNISGKRGKQFSRMNGPPGSCSIHRFCPTNPYVPSTHKSKGKAVKTHKARQAKYCVNQSNDDECDTEASDTMFTALCGARVLPSAECFV